jgi:two-component system, chemotaxis family, protein-glutamate methylesterase/glutaminase
MKVPPGEPFVRRFDIVVVAASAGGVTVLLRLVRALPADFSAPIVVVQHLAPRSSALAELLNRGSRIDVHWAEDGEMPHAAAMYLAPPDQHLTLTRTGLLHLDHGAPINYSRPAADPLFRSAAALYRSRALGVILTGNLSDGADGAAAIHDEGGCVIAQDPASCLAPGMPRAAIARGAANFVLAPARIADALVKLVMHPVEPAGFPAAPAS